ncbi:hypothetical protein G7062_09705 [Erysipelothrix sp. HDW6C]|uniref:LiaF transmembrane domain-containing protein n=1 Tax=Erysipelothrix sp. HDW6C TaxID=2714930 RepID=UPI00140C4550|nr:hypothetical protein [Erysipelothrix sp. HDW6C]QIK70559.1 hypothetical protein G7062_09705 [Erysipelothrix sp. HDW6C]
MKKRNLFWGLFFTVIAVALFGQMFNFFTLGTSVFNLFLTALLVIFAISNLPSLNFFGIVMPLTYALYINSKFFNFDPSFWQMTFAGLLLSIGLQMIFKRPRVRVFKYNDYNDYDYSNRSEDNFGYSKKNDDFVEASFTETNSDSSGEKDSRATYEEDSNNEKVRISANFTDRTRYVRSTNFTDGSIENNFGSLRVYFDQSTFNRNGSKLYVDCNFGQIVLYLPSDLNVINNVSTTLGGIDDDFNRAHKDGPTLTIYGDVSFGNLKIIFI